jgi:hypothetical protein
MKPTCPLLGFGLRDDPLAFALLSDELTRTESFRYNGVSATGFFGNRSYTPKSSGSRIVVTTLLDERSRHWKIFDVRKPRSFYPGDDNLLFVVQGEVEDLLLLEVLILDNLEVIQQREVHILGLVTTPFDQIEEIPVRQTPPLEFIHQSPDALRVDVM